MTKPTTETDVEEWLDTLDPSNFPMRDGTHLRAIGKALTDIENAEDALVSAVNAAREAGDSWSMISLVLGTSRQAAHRKYAHKDTQKRRRNLDAALDLLPRLDSNQQPAD